MDQQSNNKRILITSTDLMMLQFLVPHVRALAEHGYVIDVACSNVGGRISEVRQALKACVQKVYVIRLRRSPFSLRNVIGLRDLSTVINRGHYDIIWTNEPVMGVETRRAARQARKSGTKVLYMVHGFHFYKGAPAKNWLLYYPIELFMSHYADCLVTINREDYARAQKLHAGAVKYLHGIGMNPDHVASPAEPAMKLRAALGIPKNNLLILSVGELLPRKNHQVMIQALGLLKDPDIHYAICGQGSLQADLVHLAEENSISDHVHFLGYRKDVMQLYPQADVFALPSQREGLGIAALEAMYCGLPLITSNINGPVDYMEQGKTGYLCSPQSAEEFAEAINTLKEHPELRKQFGDYNKLAVKPYCLDSIQKDLLAIIEEL